MKPAMENNLSETAFIVKEEGGINISGKAALAAIADIVAGL